MQSDSFRGQRRAVSAAVRHRCYQLGKAIRRAVESFDEKLHVQIWGTAA